MINYNAEASTFALYWNKTKHSLKSISEKKNALKHQFSNKNLTSINLHLNLGHPIWYVHGSKAPRGDVRKC